MTYVIYYMIGFFVIVYIARMMGEKAMKYLNTEQKAGLIDLFSKERKIGSALVLGLIAVFLFVLQMKLVAPMTAFSCYFAIMILYMIFKNYNTYTKLKAHNYPQEYISRILAASVIALLGIAAFFAGIFFTFLQH